MVAVQVMGNDTAISLAASQGNFQLNVFLPVSAYNFLLSCQSAGRRHGFLPRPLRGRHHPQRASGWRTT